jgi:predicted transposase YbfD/YdcC
MQWGGQTVISERIVDKVADYILAGKDNQKFLLDDIKEAFAQTPNIVCHTSIEKSRGRMKKKTCSVITDMVWITKTSNWKNLSSIIMIESQRTRIQSGEGEESNGSIYQAYLKQADLNMIIRRHWGIESNLH